MEQVDVVIAGGGPGGSAAGTHLARAGLKTLLLEKDTFPRFRIGESLLPYGNDLLRELGVWEKIAATGRFMPKPGAQFCTADGRRTLQFWFGRGLGPEYATTFQVERSRFDALLLDHAASGGCAIRQNSVVTGVRPERDRVTVEYDHGGVSCAVRARWLVDATGRDAVAGRLLDVPKHSTQAAKRIATYAHFHGARCPGGPAAGSITIVRMPRGWCWIIPLDAEKTSVGYVRPLSDFKASHLSPEADFERVIDTFPELARRLRGATRIGDFHTTGDYSYRFATFAPHPRVLLAGDAAGFVDPIFSSGVMLALRSAAIASRLIIDRGGSPLSSGDQRRYTREVRRMMEVYVRMIDAFYDDSAFELFMHPQPVLRIPDAVAAVVGGNTNLPFRLRWRLEAFYFLCRLQRRIAIAPRIPYLSGDTSEGVLRP